MAPVSETAAARHGSFAVGALMLLAGLGLWMARAASLANTQSANILADIAIEHAEPADAELAIGRGSAGTIIDMRIRSAGPIRISTPADWRLREARGIPLADIDAAELANGFRRWSLPGNGLVSFETRTPVAQVRIHNPTAIPLHADVTFVEITTGKKSRADAIVGEGPVTLP